MFLFVLFVLVWKASKGDNGKKKKKNNNGSDSVHVQKIYR